jgi:hypothetical protein
MWNINDCSMRELKEGDESLIFIKQCHSATTIWPKNVR